MLQKIAFLLVALISSNFIVTASQSFPDQVDSRFSEREYRRFILPNQMKVFLISDPTIQRSAASLSVAVGSLQNPKDQLGMAHFLEHMLFLGTKKYPEVGSYQKFISQHDGFSNAYTTTDHTNYHFQISNDYLEPALDRLSQFFVSPLFDPNYVERERKIVDSEHSQNLSNDFRRIYEVERLAFLQTHPSSNFATGNLETLKDVTRGELIKFYEKHYSSNVMSLVVMGATSLDQLQQWVTTRFANVPNYNVPTFSVPTQFLKSTAQPQLIKVKTIKDTRTLKLSFALPPTSQYYDSKPLNILGFLIGHEGKGSLLSLLKAKHLATGLSAGGYSPHQNASIFSISVSLTKLGLEKYPMIMQHIFEYIHLLKEKGIPQYIFEENQKIAEIDYRFAAKQEGTAVVNRLSANMLIYPLSTVESIPYTYREYRPELYQKLLQEMKPENLWVTVASQEMQGDQVEYYYQTPYSKSLISKEMIGKWQQVSLHPSLTLPRQNPFLPNQLSQLPEKTTFSVTYQTIVALEQAEVSKNIVQALRSQQDKVWSTWEKLYQTLELSDSAEDQLVKNLLRRHASYHAEKILDAPAGIIWYSQDTRLQTPKAQLTLFLNQPIVYSSPRQAVIAQLYRDSLLEGLNELRYEASLAGLNFSLGVEKGGISLVLWGYSDQITTLLSQLTPKLFEITIDQNTFITLKESRSRGYQNTFLSAPYQQAFYYRNLLLEEQKYPLEAYQQELEKIRLEDVKTFPKRFFSSTYLQAVVHGNISRKTAYESVQAFLKKVQKSTLDRGRIFQEKTIQLSHGQSETFVKDIPLENSAIVLELQTDQSTPKHRGAMLIMSRALKSRFYTELRTKQQTGYIVSSGMADKQNTLSLIFIIQSGQFSAEELQQRIEKFLPTFWEEVANLSPEEFRALRQSIINAKLNKTKTIPAETNRIFQLKFRKNLDDDHVSEAILALENLQLKDLQEVVKNYFLPKQQKKLSIQMRSHQHQKKTHTSADVISSIAVFKDGKKAL